MEKAQMFKFVQMRPVNGIDVNKIERKHIPLYPKDQVTGLLTTLRKSGLPNGLLQLNKYIQTKTFKARVSDFNGYSSLENQNTLPQLVKLVFALQKAMNSSENLPFLNGKENALFKDLPINLRKLEFDLEAFLKELSSVKKSTKNVVRDDYYALALQSSYYPEYRRYLDILLRILVITEEYETETITDIIFSKSIPVTDREFEILKRLFKGRILLPKGVETDSGESSSTNDTSSDDSSVDIDEWVKGSGLIMHKLRLAELAKGRKTPVKDNSKKK